MISILNAYMTENNKLKSQLVEGRGVIHVKHPV